MTRSTPSPRPAPTPADLSPGTPIRFFLPDHLAYRNPKWCVVAEPEPWHEIRPENLYVHGCDAAGRISPDTTREYPGDWLTVGWMVPLDPSDLDNILTYLETP